ncbi:MAG: hypothetical protein Q9187_000742 [Circinaria calcarea]
MESQQRESELRERVLSNTSGEDGHLEEQTLDIDARTMQIMGKRQQLKVVSTFQGGLVNGGPSSLVYGFILSFFGSLATATSLAEMASM